MLRQRIEREEAKPEEEQDQELRELFIRLYEQKKKAGSKAPRSKKKKAGSKDEPKREKLRQRIKREEAKPEEEQDQELREKLCEEEMAPLSDFIKKKGSSIAHEIDQLILGVCGDYCASCPCCLRCTRIPTAIFFTVMWWVVWVIIPALYAIFLAHPKAFICPFEMFLVNYCGMSGSALKIFQAISFYSSLGQSSICL